MIDAQREVYRLFDTSVGWIGIRGVEGRLRRLVLPKPSREIAKETLFAGTPANLVESKSEFSDVVNDLVAYFEGVPVNFVCPVDITTVSEFDRSVLEAVRKIRYGTVTSYGKVALCIGIPRGARAVGRALGRNPVPIIIPCHRGICSNGALGGFTGGLEWKKRLLDLESGVMLKSLT
mgnify:CR=1 FL=1